MRSGPITFLTSSLTTLPFAYFIPATLDSMQPLKHAKWKFSSLRAFALSVSPGIHIANPQTP